MFYKRCIADRRSKDEVKQISSKPRIKNLDEDETRPPPYESLFGKNSKFNIKNTQTKIINGREYYVFDLGSGNKRLIPVRAPSSFLYRTVK